MESAGGWGLVGSTEQPNRYAQPKQGRRGRRWCWRCQNAGIRNAATHQVFANGVSMAADMCEFHAHQWVKNPQQ